MIVDSEEAITNPFVGGKARSLAQLKAAGFNPPDFFVILPCGFDNGKPTDELKSLLPDAIGQLGSGPFAVRSSGRAEDGAEHSHAGQFDTFLEVDAAEVLDKALQVWESGFSARVSEYTKIKTGAEVLEPPAVVVQKLIPAAVSGVAFSADPVSGQRNRVVIAAIQGFGDALVSGQENGQSWMLEDDLIISAPQELPILDDPQIKDVAALVRRAEQEFTHPQDVEWAIDNRGLHILQSRAITTELKVLPNANTELNIFDNSNIVESYPGMVSPLTYSFAVHVYSRVYRAFVKLMGVGESVIADNGSVFDNMLSRRNGRVYYNLVNWYRALALLPGFSLNRAHMETMMGVSEPLPAEVVDNIGPPDASGLAKLREFLRLLRAGFGLALAAIKLPLTRRAFYKRLNRSLNSGLNLNAANTTELVREYRRLESELLDQWDAPLINDFFCMMSFGASRNLLEKWLGTVGLSLHNDVMIGQGDIVSAEPAQRILQMGKIARLAGLDLSNNGLKKVQSHESLSVAFNEYLAKFSDRCTEELKLESITLDQNPQPLINAVAASAERNHVHAKPPVVDYNQLFEGRRLRKYLARAVIRWTKARVRDRENLRFERTRVFGYARRLFLAIGRELSAHGAIDHSRDVFYLTKDEVLGAVEGFASSPNLRALIALRKSEDDQWANQPDPAQRIEVRGAASIVDSVSVKEEITASGTTQIGTGCSAGLVKASACVIRDPARESLAPGDILIARHTDPGWIAVFSNASAIVVERGSLLSHSAIVARELGIPCVVGLKNATHWIQNGELIEVDGETGRVQKLDD